MNNAPNLIHNMNLFKLFSETKCCSTLNKSKLGTTGCRSRRGEAKKSGQFLSLYPKATVPARRAHPGVFAGLVSSVPGASLQTGPFAEPFPDRALHVHIFTFPFLALFGLSPCFGHDLSILTLDIWEQSLLRPHFSSSSLCLAPS